jgi:hypothetical protein
MSNGLYAQIAQGPKPIQLENPLNQMAKVMEIQGAGQQRELNALKIAEARRGAEESSGAMNYLRSVADPYAPEVERELASRFGQTGLTIAKSLREGQKAGVDLRGARLTLAKGKIGEYKNFLVGVNTPEDAQKWTAAVYSDPDLAPVLSGFGGNVQQALAAIPTDPEQFAQWKQNAMMRSEDFLKMIEPTSAMREYEFGKKDPGFVGYQTKLKSAAAPKIMLPEQEKAFESELGKGQAQAVLKSKEGAEDARQIIDTVNIGRSLLNSGAITGFGADFLVNLNSGLKQAGIDLGYADAASNSQAYMSALGNNVGRIIKLFGAGTGLSDADREYAAQIAGGKIQLNEAALRRILDINETASRNVIALHNKKSKDIKTNIPLTVEMPLRSNIPQQAADYLRQNPNFRKEFDAKYGKGAAAEVLGE